MVLLDCAILFVVGLKQACFLQTRHACLLCRQCAAWGDACCRSLSLGTGGVADWGHHVQGCTIVKRDRLCVLTLY